MQVKIVLPWISSKLHAHAKGHWRQKADATASARKDAHLTALDMLNRKQAEKIKGRSVIEYYFFVPDLIRRDAANMVQGCKPYVDGIVDAGLIEGDHWAKLVHGGVAVELDRERPRVELIFRSIA